MTRLFHLGLDIDGVLACFNGADGVSSPYPSPGFASLLIKTSGRNLFPAGWSVQTWSWWDEAGYTPAEAEAAWAVVKDSPSFWYTLKPAEKGVHAFLRWLSAREGVRTTFLTTRPGLTSHQQSVDWLKTFGVRDPQVLICRNAQGKGQFAQLLKLDAYVDDYVPNVDEVRRMAPGCEVKLFHQPWNAGSTLPRIYGMDELGLWIHGAVEAFHYPKAA